MIPGGASVALLPRTGGGRLDAYGDTMRLDEAIRRDGFRRWYERQLYEGHAYLVTGFLALIMMAIALEVISFRRSAAGLLALIAIGAAGGALCVFAWRRFTALLSRAEYVAERAVCPACHVYAKFRIEHADDAPGSICGCTLAVRCRSCGHGWTIA